MINSGTKKLASSPIPLSIKTPSVDNKVPSPKGIGPFHAFKVFGHFPLMKCQIRKSIDKCVWSLESGPIPKQTKTM